MPTSEELAEMGAFNKPYRESGVVLEANGFLASSMGARLHFSEDAEPSVKRGPFELENLVTGYWILRLDSLEQVIEWAKKIPFKKGSVEICEVADAATGQLKQ